MTISLSNSAAAHISVKLCSSYTQGLVLLWWHITLKFSTDNDSLSSGHLTGSHGGQLSGSGDPQADASGHLVGHVPASLPQPEHLGVGGVLHRPGQHHLSHELVLHRVAVPHLRKGAGTLRCRRDSSYCPTSQNDHLQDFDGWFDHVEFRQIWCPVLSVSYICEHPVFFVW